MSSDDRMSELRTSSKALADVTDRCIAQLDGIPARDALDSVLGMALLMFHVDVVGFTALREFIADSVDGHDVFYARHSADGMRQIADAIHRTCDRIEKEAKPKDPEA